MLKNKRLLFLLSIVWFSLPHTIKAEENYTPPQMYFSDPVSKIAPEEISPKLDIITPSQKPKVKLTPVKAQAIGLSKTVEKAEIIDRPKVKARSLMPSPAPSTPHAVEEERQKIETTIAFLPSGIDLTKVQKKTFKDMIKKYFIERDARSILIKVYASPSSESKIKHSAKRKALARGLSIRDWLLSLNIKPDQITLKAIGHSNDKNLPDRADIQIVY